jgi:uncharacterized protein YjiS (DUF1127 family)
MATLAHRSLTNCQAIPLPQALAAPQEAGLLSRVAATLRLWQRRSRERQELARLSERELRDLRASSSEIWWEIRQPFWRSMPPF